MKANNRINIGDLIMVAYPQAEHTNNPARKLDGEQFVVKTKRKVNTYGKGGDSYIYTLYGAESKMGVPYSFLTDELIKL